MRCGFHSRCCGLWFGLACSQSRQPTHHFHFRLTSSSVGHLVMAVSHCAVALDATECKVQYNVATWPSVTGDVQAEAMVA